MTTNQILVTGGAGYIGSHTVVQLLEAGFEVTILDNFSNSSPISVPRVQDLANKKVTLEKGDILDQNFLNELFRASDFYAVIHFAGLKAVGESEAEPLKYYQNNVSGSANLIQAMLVNGVNNLIFSSSATVYGHSENPKCDEATPLKPINVYGRTKLIVEDLIRDVAHANPQFNFGILRYFNPVGAHISGRIGEDPNGIPNNLMPFISQVAVGKREKVSVWGNDYPTPDGTGKRDYIHVEDLAAGHLAALSALQNNNKSFTVNLGTGNSYSVLEVINAFEKASALEIPYQIADRRPGDVAENFADPKLAENLLGWKAKFDLDRMCEDAWRWQVNNPDGYN